MIPAILFRCVPEHTEDQVERWWRRACALHGTWEHRTYRDPLEPAEWPLTSGAWNQCRSGAQRAGLIRLEALLRHGGIYLDSDVELFRPLDPLLNTKGFAAWEDRRCVPDAVLGAEADHPAIRHALAIALERVPLGAWASGPGATTDAFKVTTDILILPPAAFYPYHYTQKERAKEPFEFDPWCFGAHHWAGSWLTQELARSEP